MYFFLKTIRLALYLDTIRTFVLVLFRCSSSKLLILTDKQKLKRVYILKISLNLNLIMKMHTYIFTFE